MKIYQFLNILLIINLLNAGNSCERYSPRFNVGEIEGYAPIYESELETIITLQEPRTIEKSGNIYIYKKLILINERNKGFHIINNADSLNPVQIGFLNIPLNHDLSIRNDIIYANSGTDLLAIKLDNQGVTEVKRLKGIFDGDNFNESHPPTSVNHYFECVDETKGKVVGWELRTINNPQCYY